MADGITPGYALSHSRWDELVAGRALTIQDSLTHRVKITSLEATSFPKVRFNVPWGTFIANMRCLHRSSRRYDPSERMVCCIITSIAVPSGSAPPKSPHSTHSLITPREFSRGILHDPELYPDPERFNPERFLSKVTITAAAGDPDDDATGSTVAPRPIINDPSALPLAFGAGRRICPGRHFVDATLFILAASVLAVYDVSKPKKGGLAGSSSNIDESGATENGLIW